MEVTKKTEDLITRWQAASKQLNDAERQVSSLRCEVANSINALGKHLWPEDGKPDETFCVWYGDSLIAVSNPEDFNIAVRKRGKSLA